MAEQNKYRINELINQLPKAQTTEWVTGQLEKEGIKKRTFFRDKAIMLDDGEDIPMQRMVIYAKFFGVELGDLLNYTVKTKSAFERGEHNKKSKTGLA